jgi:LysM repeat protein
MRVVVRLLLAGMWTVSLLLLVYPARAQAQADGGSIHTVAAGETLTQIAQRYGVDVATLLELNSLPNANLVYVGQQLIVPGGGNWEQPQQEASQWEEPRWADDEPVSLGPSYKRQGVGWEPQQSGSYQRAGVGWQPQESQARQSRPGVGWEPQNAEGDGYENGYPEEAEWEAAPSQRNPYYQQEWESVHSESNDFPPGSSWKPRSGPEAKYGEELTGEKWIEVDIGDQVLIAYQGDSVVRFFTISSGSVTYPTITGSFRTYARTELQDMWGGSAATGDYYFQADVPWVQYFFEAYAIHGAYWHNNFGRPVGHGCINMRVEDSQWLYEWTGVVGIRVEVHQ